MQEHLRQSAASEPSETAPRTGIDRAESGMYDILDFVRRPMVITEGDMHLVCYVNPAFCLLAGKNKEELIGNLAIYLTPPSTMGCGLTSLSNGMGATNTAC
jgi:hypothetical protein